jgi:GNAT superfamily N-acetyltransferase
VGPRIFGKILANVFEEIWRERGGVAGWGMSFVIQSLCGETWDAYAGLIARHNGVWGGCWCMGFHAKGPGWGVSAEANRAEKQALVATGRARAALVFEGETCLGWCQYGPPADLPRIKHRKAYDAGAGAQPAWRITCFFVDRAARGRGVAEAALHGALGLMVKAGGGVVESMPEEAGGRKVAGSFLANGEVGMFDRAGFDRVRKLGAHVWLVRRELAPGG